MTIEDDEVSLGYLLDPCFELSNSEGKPLTGGYIELYIHGTRNKYYAASDFEGTLHPFQIPLDSLGSNIVLVSPSFSYDIYVYNRFGNLVMSRYNVCAIGAGGGSASTVSIESSDGTVEITATSSGYDLSVMDLYEAIQAVTASYATIEYVDNSVSSFVTEERVSTMIDEALSGYEPGEIYTGGQYVQITDENVINVTGLQPAGNYLTPEDLNGYATIEYVDNSVSSFTTHTEVYDATVTAIQAATAQMPDQLEAGDYVSIVNNTINVTGLQPAGDYATETEVHDATVTAIQTVTGLIPEAQIQSNWAQTDSTKVDYIRNKPVEQVLVAGNGIDITVTGNNVVISSTNEGITEADIYNATVTAVQTATAQIPDVSDFATEAEVYNAVVTGVQLATGLIPDVSNFTTETEVYNAVVTGVQLATGLIPDVSDLATHTEVYDSTVTAIEYVTAMIPEAQVQSNWTEADPSDPSYIQNKPADKQLVAGDGIYITSNATGVIINSAVTSIEGYVTEEQLIAAVSAVTGIGDYGRFYATDISGAATLQKVRGTLDVTNDGKIQLKQGGSYHVTVRGGYNQSVPTNEYTTANYIEYVTNSTIAINVDNTVTATQYFEISYDIYPLVNDTNYYVFFSLPSNATITNLNIDVHAIGQVGTGSGGGGGSTEYDAGWGIQILNNVISVDPTIIPVVSNFATEAEVYDAVVTGVQLATGLIPDVSDFATHTEVYESSVTSIQLVTGLIPDVSDFTTESEVYDATVTAIEHVTALIPAAQVQSDWIEDDTNDPSYIQNKPIEKELTAGNNITIVETATAFVINATNIPVVTGYATEAEVYNAVVTGVQLATGLIPDTSDMATQTWVGNQGYLTEVPSTYATDTEVSEAIASSITDFVTESEVTALLPDTEAVTFEELDITQFAMASAIPDVSNLASKTEVYDAVVTGVQLATGLIPDVSDMATQTWVTNQGYLTSVPDTYATDTEVSEAVVTGVQTATGWVDSQGYLTSVPSTYATDTEVSEAIASSITDFVTEEQVTALIPDTEEVTFEELDISAFALASSVPTVGLNGNDQVTGINGHEIAGDSGSTYTAGQYISIDANDVISVTGVAAATAIPESKEVTFEEIDLNDYALASAIPVFTEGNCIDITSNVISWETTAGITDIQMVTALPANPVSSVLYIIPEA